MRRAPSSAPKAFRLLAAAALGSAVALGAAGCSLTATQATEIQYSPSDGINVHTDGPLDVRNALVVANADGSEANFVAAIVNVTDERETLNVAVGEDGDRITVTVPARSTVSLGVGDTEPLALGDIATPPGATLGMYFQSGDAEGTVIAVPVLDDSFAYLATLAPES